MLFRTYMYYTRLSKLCNAMFNSFKVGNTVDSPYLQEVFVKENIAIKRSARLPESSIQTQSLTELQM